MKKKLEEVRLLESRKSARLLNQGSRLYNLFALTEGVISQFYERHLWFLLTFHFGKNEAGGNFIGIQISEFSNYSILIV